MTAKCREMQSTEGQSTHIRGGRNCDAGPSGLTNDRLRDARTLDAGNRVGGSHTAFLLLDNFSLISYSSAIEPLRMANKVLEQSYYSYSSYSLDGETVRASNGTVVASDGGLRDLEKADLLIVCSSDDVEGVCLPRWLGGVLRSLERHGCRIGGICTGAYVLAQLGFLEDQSCTIHWEYDSVFRETFPEVELTQNLVEPTGRCMTSAGGIAPLDLMLHYIRAEHGEAVSGAIADVAILHSQRDCDLHQRLSVKERLGIHHPQLLKTITLMEQNIENPLTLDELAAHNEMSARQIQRLFKQSVGTPPNRYYLNLRLAAARDLLRRTTMPVSEVVFACGFVSASHFSRCYRERYDVSPHSDRRIVGMS